MSKTTTYIQTAHEEQYSDSSYTIGVLLNYDEDGNRVDSFAYLYRDGIYIFFNTIINLIDYLVYDDGTASRAYLKEAQFDLYYDSSLNGNFDDYLEWVND